MPGTFDLALVFRWMTLAGVTLTAARLLHAGLHRKYRVFFAYLLFSMARSGVLLTLSVRSALYAKIWIVTEPLLWIFYVLLLLELYSLILSAHKGLYTVGRWALYGSSFLAIAASMVTFAMPSNDLLNQSQIIALILVIERGLLGSLVLFLFLLLGFLSRYPLTLTRNVVVYSIVYAGFFLSNTLGFLVRSTLGYEMGRPVNSFLMGISAVCATAWLLLLNREGEKSRVHINLLWNSEQEARMTGQLDNINSALLRLARK